MKNINSNSAIRQVIWPPKFGDLKLPEPEFAHKIWVKSNPQAMIQMAITWATKLQLEWYKKENKVKTIGNIFYEGSFAKF